MSFYAAIRPLLFTLDAERAHRATIRALRLKPGRAAPASDPRLAIRVAGLDFPNPVGLAAGFDKDAQVPDAMLGLGFGFGSEKDGGGPTASILFGLEDSARSVTSGVDTSRAWMGRAAPGAWVA